MQEFTCQNLQPKDVYLVCTTPLGGSSSCWLCAIICWHGISKWNLALIYWILFDERAGLYITFPKVKSVQRCGKHVCKVYGNKVVSIILDTIAPSIVILAREIGAPQFYTMRNDWQLHPIMHKQPFMATYWQAHQENQECSPSERGGPLLFF